MWREKPRNSTTNREEDAPGKLGALHVRRAEMGGLFVGQRQNINMEPCEMAINGG